MELNPQQQAAAHFGGMQIGEPAGAGRADPLLIIAGAGTGKTLTLAHRVAHLLVTGGDSQRILLLTFTRRAAREMTRRAERIVQQGGAGARSAGGVRFPWSGTFHSVANRLLRRHGRAVQLDPSFSIADRSDSADLMDMCRHELGLADKQTRFPRKTTCLDIYSRCVNTTDSLQSCLELTFPWCLQWHDELRRLFRHYVEAKQRSAVLDYDDLLLYWFYMVKEPAMAARLSGQFDHILVDEYQDTNVLQSGILHALRPDGRGVTVVGDDAQSIYSFRAACVDNILEFPESFSPPARVIRLETNYRSTQPILDAANALMAPAPRQFSKCLTAHRGRGHRPSFVTVEDDSTQSDYVIDTILANREAGVALRDQAVLFRNTHHSDGLEVELTRRNIPFVKYGGLKFLEAAHIKDLLAVLRWAENPRNRLAGFRVVQMLPGIGPGHAARCLDFLAASGDRLAALQDFSAPAPARAGWPGLATLMAALPAADWPGQVEQAVGWYRPYLESGYHASDPRLADLEQLQALACRFPGREQFLSELSLDPPQASGDQAGPPLLDEDYLVLSTAHSAKGQEWKSVFVLNVTDGSFPSEFATGDAAQVEEERRLLYVAMTRARDDLHLLCPLRFFVTQQRRWGDRHVYGARSRFLTDDVLECFERRFHGAQDGNPAVADNVAPASVDVGAHLRNQW